ncbi:hypothetical protein F5X97DRAFT_16808 [Nemania serpens]|nr:hypothetical protein F5X97DRAFT_16808 [Nemania serpens]
MSFDGSRACGAADTYAFDFRYPPTSNSAITPYGHSFINIGDSHDIDIICESFRQPLLRLDEPQDEWLLEFTRFRDIHLRNCTVRPANNPEFAQSSTATTRSRPLQTPAKRASGVTTANKVGEDLHASALYSSGDTASKQVEEPRAVHTKSEGSATPTTANCHTGAAIGPPTANDRDCVAPHARQRPTLGNCNVDTVVKQLRDMEQTFLADTKRRMSQVRESAG